MPPVGFEPTISAGERPQTHVLDPAATETGLSAGPTSKTNKETRKQVDKPKRCATKEDVVTSYRKLTKWLWSRLFSENLE